MALNRKTSGTAPLNEEQQINLYTKMIRIRLFEEKVLALFQQGELRGTSHLCIGQEAIAAGACAALEPDDYVTSNHRGHGHMLARGASMQRMFAELFGKETGYAKGCGGSQHMAAEEVGFLGSNGITGGGLPIATGAALSLKLRSKNNITLAFLGDGATAQGTFHEAMNLATLWQLPVIFLCENNQYAMGTSVYETCPQGDICTRASGYGLEGIKIDGNNPFLVYQTLSKARSNCLQKQKPVFIEAVTYRQTGHSRSDSRSYIKSEEIDFWQKKEPLAVTRKLLIKQGVEEKKLVAAAAGLQEEIEHAVKFARHSDGMPLSKLGANLYPQPISPGKCLNLQGKQPVKEEKTYAQAIYLALAHALESDPNIILLGEDIADYGGAFKVTRDLHQRFGKARVRNTPISENTIIGCATGAAMTGLRPVAEIMFMDFMFLALDQLANHAAKFSTIYGNQFQVPLVVRTPAGGRRGYGATHSQCLESLLLSIPGLKIFCPATVQDAYDLLLEAISCQGPVVVVEHKLLYGQKGLLDTGQKALPAGKARILQKGSDLTIATFSHMTLLALQAAKQLSRENIFAEVIDLRTLNPLDFATLATSATKTQRVIVAEEGHLSGGVTAELAARIQEECFGYLDAPILRIAAKDLPIPAALTLEQAVLPQVGDIVAAAKTLLDI